MEDRVLVFDLGGVVLSFDHMLPCQRLASLSDSSADSVYRLVFVEGLERLYDEGKISSREFHSRIMDALELDVTFAEFGQIWSDIFEENVDVSRLIRQLKKAGHPVYLLSNTNELHYRWVRRKFNIVREFDEYILSYQIGYRKPAPEIFHAALAKSDVPANRHVYVDDIEEYVRAAQTLGIVGLTFLSASQLENQLQGMLA